MTSGQPGLFPQHQRASASSSESASADVRLAADVLGWAGRLAPRTKLLGIEVHPVVEIDERAHAVRKRRDQHPVLDHDVLAMWEWTEAAPVRAPEVVKLRGVLPTARAWRSALAGAARLRGFCSAAVLLAPPRVGDECLLECKLHGVGVLEHGESGRPRLVEPARDGRAPRARRRTLDRWIEELVYQELIDAGMLD